MPTALVDAGGPFPGSPSGSPSSSIRIGRLHSSPTPVPAAYTPGQILAGRYRMIGLLGRGGMGEVYRADDLKLGQPVSLKFLSRSLAKDPARLERFLAEIRLARQVSHPNVCRVYDLGEIDGSHFLTMEYVDGEDLATLLHRIGRLPAGKAHEVARQLCAGLAAAHEKGVLHRDLKPSNVMIDGHGRVRITDFGLAVRADEAVAGGLVGTPAYMAPEQFEGAAVSERSDLYSLGLVLYELYTGRKPFEGASLADWKERHTRSVPTPPSGMERDIDEAAERVILRCLHKDPAKRPASALVVAAALPGGDPLAAALAAGEPPSPEMVAAAGGEGAISIPVALALAGGILAAVASLFLIAPYSTDFGLARPTKGPEVLGERARQIAARFGYDASPLDSEAWFVRDYDPMRWLSRHSPSTEWRARMHGWPPPVLFVQRQSPRWLAAPYGAVNGDLPPHEVTGMAGIILDGRGDLRAFRGVPPQREDPAARGGQDTSSGAGPPDWNPLFEYAGLQFERFQPVEPEWVPPAAFDAWAEWVGAAPGAPDVPLRVSAAAFRGRPVSFAVLGPWSRPERMETTPVSMSRRIAGGTIGFSIAVVLVFALVLARRNLKRGRGDRRGALRLAIFVFGCESLAWAAGAHHVLDLPGEMSLILEALARALVSGALSGLLYMAVEPYARARMPELLIGWARLLEGRFRDPRVGRDILVGALVGGLMAVCLHVTNALPTWIPIEGQTTVFARTDILHGGRRLLSSLLGLPTEALGPGMTMFGLLLVLRLALRRPALAMAGLMVIMTLSNLGGENFALETPGALVIGLMAGFTIARFGLLTSVTIFLVCLGLAFVALPLSSSYAASSMILVVLFLALAAYAFRISIGPRPLFSVALED